MIRRLEAEDEITQALAGDRLGLPAVLFFVMSAAAPLTVVAGVLTTGYAVTGNVGLPSAFVVVGVVLALFSVGYVTMSRHLPHAGAFYAYVSHGVGKTFGVGAAWVALFAYNLLQVGLYGAVGVASAPLVKEWIGIELPWWVFALIAWVLVAVLGVFRVDINGKVLAVLLVIEVSLILVYDVSYLAHPAHGLDFSILSPTELFKPGVGAILAIAVLGFVGFESAVVFTEESRNPRRTVPVATYVSVVVIAGVYGLSAGDGGGGRNGQDRASFPGAGAGSAVHSRRNPAGFARRDARPPAFRHVPDRGDDLVPQHHRSIRLRARARTGHAGALRWDV
jgi:amino acid transporter